MLAVKSESQAIGEFLDWLATMELVICERHRHSTGCIGDDGFHVCGLIKNHWVPANLPIEATLAQYFEIDLEEAEREKRALLARIEGDDHGRRACEAAEEEQA